MAEDGLRPCFPPSSSLVPPREDALPPVHRPNPNRTCPGNRSGGLVAQSAVAPPGPIPNPVVTHRSAGEYCGVAPREARPLRAPPIGSNGQVRYTSKGE
jgi:hypothetical protein